MRPLFEALIDEARHRAAVILLCALALLWCWALSGCATRVRVQTAPSTAPAARIAAAQQEQVRNAAREIREQAAALQGARGATDRTRTLAELIDYKATILLEQ